MARARSSGGGAAFAWALVVVGTGFFIFLILFVVTYTQNTRFQQEREEAVVELERFANAAQRRSTDVQQIISSLDQRQRETVVSRLMAENSQLKSMITADGNLSVDAINTEKTQGMSIPGPLLTHVATLNQNLDATREQVNAARAAQAAAERRATDVATERDRLAETFRADLARASSNFDTIGRQFTGATQGFEQVSTNLRADMERVRGELQRTIDEKDAEIEELRAQLAVAIGRITILERERADTLGPPDVIPADGVIISLVPDQRTVFINRGSRDFIQLGMTFEVFNADELIRLNAYDELRGKATIEVISMEDNTAVARIVRQQRGANITPNDQIANLIYDANRVYKFHVYGDFDIDNVGQATTRDRDRIKSMITRWGGRLSDELNWDVDFLVLGREPPIPDPLDPDEIDPTIIRAHAEMTANYETYNRLANTARELSVPVLNQNRFLALTGYYRR